MVPTDAATQLFIDTNVLLQCRALVELPWTSIGRGPTRCIVIPRPVQEEVDALKQDGNTRRARRARTASALLRDLLSHDGEAMPLQEKRPDILVALGPSLPLESSSPLHLGLSTPDDRIVGEALAFAQHYPQAEVILVTGDTGPLLTAKRRGLSYYMVPDDWLLPPENDPRDKRLDELERQVSRLAADAPLLRCTATVPGGADRIRVLRYRPLPEARVRELCAAAAAHSPEKLNFRRGPSAAENFMLSTYHPPSPATIEAYHRDYEQWLERFGRYLRGLPALLALPHRTSETVFRLSNEGSRPASHLLVDIEALGGLLLAEDAVTVPGTQPRPPAPPVAPAGRLATYAEAALGLATYSPPDLTRLPNPLDFLPPLPPPPRDRYEFYWKDEKPREPVSRWRFECEEFRHHGEHEDFQVQLLVPLDYSRESGALRFRVTAENAPKRLEVTQSYSISYEEVDIESQLASLLPWLDSTDVVAPGRDGTHEGSS